MRATALIAAVLALALAPLAARAQPVTAKVGAASIRDDVYPRAEAQFPAGVVGLPDVEFANLVGFRPLQMDIYMEAKTPAPRPLVLWIHGGGWNRGDARASGAISDYPALLASLAARGYVVASVNYRLSGEARFPAQIQDVNAAILFLKDHAAAYGIDTAKVFLWGGSAGGQLAGMAALTCGQAAYRPESSGGRLSHAQQLAAKPPAGSTCVQGAVIWYGVSDLTTLPEVSATQMLGCDPKRCVATARKASPLYRVGAAPPPMLLIHGLADTQVSPNQTKALAAALSKAGGRVQTLYLSDVDHGLIGKTQPVTEAATLKALQASFDFFDALAGKSK